MKHLLAGVGAAALLAFATAVPAFAGMSATYKITVTNTSAEELIAPVLVTSTKHDRDIFDGDYVTPEAEHQVLTGDPAMLAERIGAGAAVAHGNDGPPGVLLAPGNSLTFNLTTDASEIRVFAMVAPTVTPDNYLTTTVTLAEGGDGMFAAAFERHDIGHDEKTMMIAASPAAFGTVEVSRQ